MAPISGGVCSICGERMLTPHAFVVGQEDPRCGLCRRSQPPFSRAVAYGSYEGGLRGLIHQLKYEQVRSAVGPLGHMLAQAISKLDTVWTQSSIVIVPVPLHPRRLRQRGFNQTKLTVQEAMKLSDRNARMVLRADVLERRRETQPQTGLTRNQRRENIRGAFAVVRPDEIAGQEVLLVDDVYTTGTTVSECARVLLRAGASKIYVATVARTLKADTNVVALLNRFVQEDGKPVEAAG